MTARRNTVTLCVVCLVLLHLGSRRTLAAEVRQAESIRMPAQNVVGAVPRSNRIVILGMAQAFPRESWAEVERRTAAELRALGLDVVTVAARAETTDTRLAELGAQSVAHNAFASIRIVRRAGKRHLQLWVFDAATGKMVLRRVEIGGSEANAVANAALETLDLLSASLLEIRLRRRRRPIEPVHPKVAELVDQRLVDDPPTRQRFSAAAGFALIAPFNNVPLSAGVLLSGAWHPHPSVRLGLEAMVPLHSASFEHEGSGSKLSTMLFEVVALYEPRPHWRFSPAVGLAVGAAVVHGEGLPTSTDEGRSAWASALWTALETRVAIGLTRSMRLVGQVSLGVTVPPLRVRFFGQPVAEIGRPLLTAGLSFEYRWGY